jgi:hypothetical protein
MNALPVHDSVTARIIIKHLFSLLNIYSVFSIHIKIYFTAFFVYFYVLVKNDLVPIIYYNAKVLEPYPSTIIWEKYAQP